MGTVQRQINQTRNRHNQKPNKPLLRKLGVAIFPASGSVNKTTQRKEQDNARKEYLAIHSNKFKAVLKRRKANKVAKQSRKRNRI